MTAPKDAAGSAGLEVACAVPPEGWACTRVAGHEGPCAALSTQDGDLDLRDRLMIELAYCRHVGMPVSEIADRMLAFFNEEAAALSRAGKSS